MAMKDFNTVSVKVDGRQEFFGNVYATKEEAKAGADTGYTPVLVASLNGAEVNGWMNHSKFGYQEDWACNAK